MVRMESFASDAMDLALPAPAAPFAALDDPVELNHYSRRLTDGRWESWIAVEGMDCAACGQQIEHALMRLPGVVNAQVSVVTSRARVVWKDGALAPSALFLAIAGQGYQPYPAGSAEREHAARRSGRMLLWRLLVAAFCMMQVMMYATAEYLAGPGDITDDQLVLLRWAQWMISIPVMLFAAWPILRSAWRSLKARTLGMDVPASLGILLAFGASTVSTFNGQGEVWFDSVTMFVFFLLLARYVEAWARGRATAHLESLDRRLPATAMRADGASFTEVPAARLAQGDRIRVAPGETFPADGTVLDGDTTADESILTGESLPAGKTVGDAVVAGSVNLSASVDLLVTHAPGDSTVARIRDLIAVAAQTRPDWVRVADRWAAWFLAVVLLLAAGSWMLWQSVDPHRALSVAIAVLIVTCPCALSLAAPAAMLSATAGLARRGIWLRNPSALERLLRVRHVAFDKTGTLTQATLSLASVEPLREGVDGDAWLGVAAALASASRHPLSRALAASAPASGSTTHWREWPGQGIEANVDGRPYRLGSAAFTGAAPLAADVPAVWLADEVGPVACFTFADALRPDAAAAVSGLQANGVRCALWSGDRPEPVARLADALGMADARAAMTPDDKLRAMLAAQEKGEAVLMVGDGINDGPALARADVSATLGGAAALAQGQADLVLASGRLTDLMAVRRVATDAQRITRQNLIWAAGWNAASVPLALLGFMPPWLAGLGMAASSVLVIGNGLRLLKTKD